MAGQKSDILPEEERLLLYAIAAGDSQAFRTPTAILPNGNYKILNVNSGKALVVYNADIQQWDYLGQTNEQFTFTTIP